MTEQEIITAFHKLYYQRWQQTWGNTYYKGIQILKNPLDMWIYQELIHLIKPDIFIELGTRFASSALWFRDTMHAVNNKGWVISVDLYDEDRIGKHNNILLLKGDSTDAALIAGIKRRIAIYGGMQHIKPVVMVMLDSDHAAQHVLKELNLYAPLVTAGSYLIVEDTNINGHPVLPSFGAGPMEAVAEFMQNNEQFVVDHSCEKFLMCFATFLRSVK